MAKDFTNNATSAYFSAATTPKTAERKDEKTELAKILEGKTQAEIKELLKEYQPESRSRHIQILATPSLYARIKDRIEKRSTASRKFSMNNAFEEAMTAWLDEQDSEEMQDL